jgi:hypothetical protein
MTSQTDLAGLALIRECNDAASLFSRGLSATHTIRTDYTDAVVVMSLLALGAEKMLKLTIGLAQRDQGEGWPPSDYMRHDIGHRVLKADQIARPLLNSHAGTAPGLLDDMKSHISHDRVLSNVLNALERFGAAGRFYYLDILADNPPKQEAPHALWTDLTAAIAVEEPALLADIDSADNADRRRRRVNETIANALNRWWELYAAAWRTGAIGDEAKQYARELTLQLPAK